MNDEPQASIFRQESLERLSSPEQLDQLMQIVNPRSWLPLVSLGSLVGLALLWSIFGRIPITATGRGIFVLGTPAATQLTGLTFFSQQDQQIQPGMKILLVPDAAYFEGSGGVVGRVKSVSTSSITTLAAARQAEMTAAELQTSAIEVLVELEQDPSTLSGYRWSSRQGTSLQLPAGTTATARITLEEKAPITFIFPFLENW